MAGAPHTVAKTPVHTCRGDFGDGDNKGNQGQVSAHRRQNQVLRQMGFKGQENRNTKEGVTKISSPTY